MCDLELFSKIRSQIVNNWDTAQLILLQTMAEWL